MSEFYSNFNNFAHNGLTALQFFYKQTFETFKKNVENNTLPFFNNDLNKIPRELSTGKLINNENAIALEQVASKNGYKSNFWIYGHELNIIQKEIGNLYCKKNAEPVLCLTKYFGSTHLSEQDLYISEDGSKKNEQYLYNIDSLNEKSRQKVLKYYEKNQMLDKIYEEKNFQAFQSNVKLNQQGINETLKNAKEKVLEASRQDEMDFSVITNCHYLHLLANAIGKPELAEIKTKNQKSLCYEKAIEFIEKVKKEKFESHKAGIMLCKALNSGTELQRISVAKGFNLENAKKIEELKVAEKNRNAYRVQHVKSNSFSY